MIEPHLNTKRVGRIWDSYIQTETTSALVYLIRILKSIWYMYVRIINTDLRWTILFDFPFAKENLPFCIILLFLTAE